MFTGKISVFLICRPTYLAVGHRRDISLSYMQTHVLCRCTSVRYQSSLYTDACASPLYIGEISVFLILVQTYVPCRCISARYQSSLYTDACTSLLYIGEISVFLIHRRIYLADVHRQNIRVFLICRRTYLAVVHRRDTSFPYIQTHLVPRR